MKVPATPDQNHHNPGQVAGAEGNSAGTVQTQPCDTGAASTNEKGVLDDAGIRALLDSHWRASDANDFYAEHEIYHEDAVLEYPQSRERIRGRQKIRESREAQPNRKRFSVSRILGHGDIWTSEFILSYDGQPTYSVSIMEFTRGKVARETQYFGNPFPPGPSRAQWVERMD
jgi:hypothetical protein